MPSGLNEATKSSCASALPCTANMLSKKWSRSGTGRPGRMAGASSWYGCCDCCCGCHCGCSVSRGCCNRLLWLRRVQHGSGRGDPRRVTNHCMQAHPAVEGFGPRNGQARNAAATAAAAAAASAVSAEAGASGLFCRGLRLLFDKRVPLREAEGAGAQAGQVVLRKCGSVGKVSRGARVLGTGWTGSAAQVWKCGQSEQGSEGAGHRLDRQCCA
eukprot:365370-Chlamydomonas_euryale.AAC.11